MTLLFWLAVLLVLVGAALNAWHRAREREAVDAAIDARWDEIERRAKRIDAQAKAMDRAMSDDHECELCHTVAAVRELVPLADDAALACAGCAALLTGRGA